MKAVIYCRVSTDNQEREGTSLDSQLEACLKKASELGYDVPEGFTILEAYSGLTLERSKLAQLRQWVRDKAVDAVIAYTLDRVSRDPVHFIILQEEFERAGVELILVSEDLDSSDMGKLISHIRGYAAKLEAEKIRERTMRGRRTRIEKQGKLPTGRGILYGYSYDRQRGINVANSCLDTVRMIGLWVRDEGIPLNEVCRRLMEKDIPAPKGGEIWSRGSLGRILRNPTYAGKTYACKTKTQGKKRIACSQENQVEIPNAVDRAAFTWDEWLAIQRQLDKNRELSPRNQKLSYLLRGMVFCKQCGRKYYGIPVHSKPYYRCSGRIKLLSNANCANRTMNAESLEGVIWQEVEKVLRDPAFLLGQLKTLSNSGIDIKHLEERIKLNDNQLNTLDEAETRYLRLYGAGVSFYEKLEKECKRINLERERIYRDNADLEKQVKEATELALNADKIQQVCNLASSNLDGFGFKEKRLALESLSIKVWVDDDSITLEGILPLPESNTVSLPL